MAANIIGNIALAILIFLLARNEREFRWWKPLLIAAIASVVGVITGEGSAFVMRRTPNWANYTIIFVAIAIAIAAVVFASRRILGFNWRDAGLIGAAYSILQFGIGALLIRMS